MVAEANLASPLGASPAQIEKEEKRPANSEAPEQRDLFVRAQRRKLPDERKSLTHKFSIGGDEGYIIVGMYEEGGPGEIFIKMAKEGSTLSGFMDGLALSISIGLQYGVPLSGTSGDAPSCSTCGMLMVANGSCYKCVNCGSTSGCS